MRVTAKGAYRMSGTSKKSGANYDMANLIIEVPQEVVANATMKRIGYGHGVKELAIEPDCIQKFASFPYPCQLDLEVGQKVGFRGLEAIIVGATLAPTTAKSTDKAGF